jgi:hypothetical protein
MTYEKEVICGKCGAALQEGQEFCSKCRQKVGLSVDSDVMVKISQKNADVAKKKWRPLILGAVGVVIVAVITAVVVFSIANSDPNFENIKEQITYRYLNDSVWKIFAESHDELSADQIESLRIGEKEQLLDCISVSPDGKSMTIDTNPYDHEGYPIEVGGYYVWSANEFLGLPDYITSEMKSTTALQGRQSEEYDNIVVTWTYHPDKGLEVLYIRK